MSNIFLILFIITLIYNKIVTLYLEDCSDKLDCFNCTLTPGCAWENRTCINYTDYEYYNITNHTLLDTDNSTILYQDLKYIRNICFDTKAPYLAEENYIYNELSDKYCGPNFLIVSDWRLKNGYKIQLNNNSDIYGTPNLICVYVITHGRNRIDVDIFINRSLSHDFLLFYSDDFDESIQINYSTTLSIYGMTINSGSFLFYSNKSFETSPFIIYFKLEEILEEDSEVLTYLFLAAMIGFVVLAIVGIILVRKCSLFFNFKKNNKKNNRILEENKGNLSVISEKNVEENSKNDIDYDIQEIKKIKENKDGINAENNNGDKNNK